MLEHVRHGGKPYDVRGVHIAETVNEMAVLARFNRASQNKMFEGQTQQLVEAAREYYHNLQSNLKHMGTARGYQNYFESWTPADVGAQEALVEDLKTMFIEQTLDTRIEAALPTLAKIQGNTMKEANEFESWANKLVEGTWALPETPEAKDKLYSLLAQELPVGPDAANATEQLYDILGDDELFDRLGDLADRDANADARPVIIARMKEMGMEVPGVKPEPEVNEGDNLATFEAGCEMDESMGATVAGAVAPLEEGSSDYVGNAIEDLRISMPGLDREAFLDELYSYLDARYSKRAADAAMDHGDDAVYDEWYANYSDLAEGTGVTDYAPKSQGGTRKELLAKYHKTKNPKDAEAARKAGATQKELQGVAEDSIDPMDHRGAVTDSFYEDLARLKKLAFVKRT